MKRLVLREFQALRAPVGPLQDWPSTKELRRVVIQSPEYAALRAVGLPADCGVAAPDGLVDAQVAAMTGGIEDRFIADHVQERLSADEFCERLRRVADPIPRGYSDAYTLLERYYSAVEQAILEELWLSSTRFTEEELDAYVPDIASPVYSRERVITRYLLRAVMHAMPPAPPTESGPPRGAVEPTSRLPVFEVISGSVTP